MQISLYQVDSFSDRVFGGNPAAICPLESWLDSELLQKIATENNLSETAYLVGGGGRYRLRWFTPKREVDLCGHATLAAAYVVFEHLETALEDVTFDTQSGELVVRREAGRLAMDFPARPPESCAADQALFDGLGRQPRELLRHRDFLAVYDSAGEVAALAPDFRRLAEVDCLGIIATAPGAEVDFVSRFFAPGAGIDEDPVTGSAHCTLVPYWSEQLGKSELVARQISPRGGQLWCTHRGDRVTIAGHVTPYLQGTIMLD